MNSNWSYSPETVKLGCDLCDLDLWPLTLTFCMDITFDHGNNSWKFHDDTMMGTWWKRCDRQTDGQTDRRTDRRTENTICRAAWSQLKIPMRYRGRTVPLQMLVSSSHLEVSMYISKGRVFHYSNVQMRRYTAHSRYLAVSFLQKT